MSKCNVIAIANQKGGMIPFINKFPKNTKLYKLMSTKPNEKYN